MIKNVATVIRDIEIGVAVVVIVAGRDAHALIGVSQAGRFGNVGEGEFAAWIQVIAEQAVAGFPARGHRDQSFALRVGRIALDQKNVQIAVIVVVDQRGARTPSLPVKSILPSRRNTARSRSRSVWRHPQRGERCAAGRTCTRGKGQRAGAEKDPDFTCNGIPRGYNIESNCEAGSGGNNALAALLAGVHCFLRPPDPAGSCRFTRWS